MVETEIEEYVMPERLCKALSLQNGIVNVLEISANTLNGYVPFFIEAHHDKIASIIKIMSQSEPQK